MSGSILSNSRPVLFREQRASDRGCSSGEQPTRPENKSHLQQIHW